MLQCWSDINVSLKDRVAELGTLVYEVPSYTGSEAVFLFLCLAHSTQILISAIL
jgi:hypothetical protein